MAAIPHEPRTISQRELRNQSAAIMDGLEAGESFTVTRNGRPVGELTPIAGGIVPITGPREFVPTAELMAAFAHHGHVDYKQMRTEIDEFFGDHDEVSLDDDPFARSSRAARIA